MALHTRLTELLDIEHPILSAPMAFAAGGKLAAAVTAAGGLGLIGGGYGDAEWLKRELAEAGNARVGCGFITWSLAKCPELLDPVLARLPAAVMLSFGSPLPFGQQIKAAGAKLICQVQNIEHAHAAVDVDADIVVAQGAEAGGHGLVRSTFTLVPEVADYLAKVAPSTVLVPPVVSRTGEDWRSADVRCRRRAGRFAVLGEFGGLGSWRAAERGTRRRWMPPFAPRWSTSCAR
jgi:nitronate monooxygenase